jgi:hypothetical protein
MKKLLVSTLMVEAAMTLKSARGRGWLVALLVLGAAVGAVPCVSGNEKYSPVILADNPLGYWRLGESDPSMPAVDATAKKGNDGIYIGNVTLGLPGAIAGDTDTAFAVDGVTGFAVIPSAKGGTFHLRNNFSLEAWVINPGQITPGTAGRIFSNGLYGLGIFRGRDKLRFTTFYVQDYDSDVVVPQDGAYHYVAVTFDSDNTAHFYLDGTLQQSIPGPGPTRDDGHNLQIGGSENGELFTGTIDEAAIYKYVLTDDQIAAHYAAGIDP